MNTDKYSIYENLNSELASFDYVAEEVIKNGNIAKEKTSKQQNKVIGIIVAIAVAVCLVAVLIITQIIIPNAEKKAAQQKMENDYKQAQQLFNEGNYYDAAYAFGKLRPYENSEEMFSKAIKQGLIEAEKGDTVIFGQSEDLGVYREWIVLKREGDKVLLLQKYGYEEEEFYLYDDYYLSADNSQVYWEQSTLRGWLNHAFIMNAFDKSEMNKLDKGKSPTNDYVFLLSKDEFNKYVPDDQKAITPANTGEESYPAYYLRTAGVRKSGDIPEQLYVDEKGTVQSNYGLSDEMWVRPAVWVDVTKEGKIKDTSPFTEKGKITTICSYSHEDGGDAGLSLFVGEKISKYDPNMTVSVTYEDGTREDVICSEKTGMYVTNPCTIHAGDNYITVKDSKTGLQYTDCIVGLD